MAVYPMTDSDRERLRNDFSYHPPRADQAERYNLLRSRAMEMAGLIYAHCPRSRERSLALTKLEEVIFWANASIARNEPKHGKRA